MNPRTGVSCLLFILSSSVAAQDMDLLSFGTFSVGGANVIGGKDFYVIDCDERSFLCEDNFGNMWAFGDNLNDYRIRMCEQSIDVVSRNCVHAVEVSLRLARPYTDAVFDIQRPNCGKLEFFFNGDFLGSARGDESGVGLRLNLEYFLGLITPGKPHTLAITAPENDDGKCAPAVQIVNVTGLAIRGTSR